MSEPPTAAVAAWRSRAVDLVLTVLLVLGLVGVVTVVIVQRVVLEPDTYTSALVQADAYERVYTEILADPELADLVGELLGGLEIDPALAVDARVLSVNVLRWSAPPSVLQDGTETLIRAVLAHIRGDARVLDADVDIRPVLDRIPTSSITEARTLLASARGRVETSVARYRASIEAFAAALEAGAIPDSVPELDDDTATPDDVVAAILDGFGLEADDPRRAQVAASVRAGAERDLLVTLGGAGVRDRAAAAADDLRARAAAGRELDVIELVRGPTHRSRHRVVDTLDGAQAAAAWFGPATGVLSSAVVGVAVLGLAVTNRGDGRRARRLVALASALAGAAVLVLWWRIGAAIATPLDQATAPAPAGWGLPRGVRSVLGDVRAEIADQVAVRVLRSGALLLGVAVALFLSVVVTRTRPARQIARGPALVLGAGALLAVGGGLIRSSDPDDVRGCNGHEELCDRAYDEVAYAATHNSMSSPDVVEVWPEHDGDLRSQLDAGVRALLIDTHYWTPLVSAEQVTPSDVAVPEAVIDELIRLAGPLAEARPGTYLCHNHCAFGGTPFLDGMVQVREFLVDNPDDVVTLIIQDAITPEDTEQVMRAAGLAPYLHTHRPEEPWPTLGEMIDRGERLVVFAEEAGPPPDWYANAFESMRETPFLFREPEELSCEPNRGVEASRLLLVNHWVSRVAPDRVDSVELNSLEALLDRSQECVEDRGVRPSFLAVNFYSIGDLMLAVDRLNGVG